MAQYEGVITLAGGLVQANGNTFPLMEAGAIQVDDIDGKRLNVILTELLSKIENYVSSEELEGITNELALKAVKSEVDAALDLINEGLVGKADKDHSHDIYALKTELAALQTALEEQIGSKADVEHDHVFADITNIGEASVKYADTAGAVEWDNVENKPADFTPAAHKHKIADIEDLADANVSHAETAGTANAVAWDSITGTPETFTPAEHDHATDDIDGLDTVINNAVSTHNTATDAHNDIRQLITDLSKIVTDFLDISEEEYDQLSELITDIKANKSDIASITSDKADKSVVTEHINDADVHFTTAEREKLSKIEAEANKYVHPDVNHIPDGGQAGQILVWSADGAATWGEDKNTKYEVMKGASADAEGSSGLVPAPEAEDYDKFLKADGSWSKPTDTQYKIMNTNGTIETEGVLVPQPATTEKTGAHFLNGQGGWEELLVYEYPSGEDTTGTKGFVPAPTADDAGKFLSADGYWTAIPDFDGKYKGLVPAPAADDAGKFLKADGSWAVPLELAISIDADQKNKAADAALVSKNLDEKIDKTSIVNNLATDDADKVLSAAQGVAIQGELSRIEQAAQTHIDDETIHFLVDPDLATSGEAADAKVTGDKITVLNGYADQYILTIDYDALLAFDTTEIVVGETAASTSAILGTAVLGRMILG